VIYHQKLRRQQHKNVSQKKPDSLSQIHTNTLQVKWTKIIFISSFCNHTQETFFQEM